MVWNFALQYNNQRCLYNHELFNKRRDCLYRRTCIKSKATHVTTSVKRFGISKFLHVIYLANELCKSLFILRSLYLVFSKISINSKAVIASLADVRLHFVSNELLMPIRLMVVLALRHQNNLDEAKPIVTASVLFR